MSLFDRLEEYGGIGGRIAGARHPFKIPLSNISIDQASDMHDKMAENARRRALVAARTRSRLREIALGESRRRLKTLDS